MESRLKSEEMQVIKLNSGFEMCHSVECNGSGRDRGGWLALLWKDNVNIFITYYSSNHISGLVAKDFDDQLWFIFAPFENLPKLVTLVHGCMSNNLGPIHDAIQLQLVHNEY